MRWSEDKESWQKVLEYTARNLNEKWSPDVKKECMELSQKFYDPYAHKPIDMMPYLKHNQEKLLGVIKDLNMSTTRFANEISLDRNSVARVLDLKGFPSIRFQETVYDMYGVKMITRRSVLEREAGL